MQIGSLHVASEKSDRMLLVFVFCNGMWDFCRLSRSSWKKLLVKSLPDIATGLLCILFVACA